MDSIVVLKLYRDARQTLDTYLARDLADRILGDMLRKYHMLLTDDELLHMVEIGEVEIAPYWASDDIELNQMWMNRLNGLAQSNAKVISRIAKLNEESDRRERNGQPRLLIGWRLQ